MARNRMLRSSLMVASATVSMAKPIAGKCSHVVAENTPKGQMANKSKDLAGQRLDGMVSSEVFPNSRRFGGNKAL